jgi:hypothetical protein
MFSVICSMPGDATASLLRGRRVFPSPEMGKSAQGDERVVHKSTAADDALTREIEALRDALAGAGVDLARERRQHEVHQRDLTRLRATMRDFDEAQRELHARLNPPAS